MMKDLGVEQYLPLSREALNAVARNLVRGRQKASLQVCRRERGQAATEAEVGAMRSQAGGRWPLPPCTLWPRLPPGGPPCFSGVTWAASTPSFHVGSPSGISPKQNLYNALQEGSVVTTIRVFPGLFLIFLHPQQHSVSLREVTYRSLNEAGPLLPSGLSQSRSYLLGLKCSCLAAPPSEP